MPFQMRVGTVPGNTVWMLAPVTQYTGLTYRDRTGLRTYDAGLKVAQYAGDDETIFAFVSLLRRAGTHAFGLPLSARSLPLGAGGTSPTFFEASRHGGSLISAFTKARRAPTSAGSCR